MSKNAQQGGGPSDQSDEELARAAGDDEEGEGEQRFDPTTARLIELQAGTGDIFQIAVDANGVVGSSRFKNAPAAPKTGFTLFTNPQNGDILQIDLSTGDIRRRPDGSPHIVLKGGQPLTQEDIQLFDPQELADGSSVQVLQMGNRPPQVFQLSAEQVQANLTVSHTIDTDLDGVDDHAVLSDQRTLIALSAPDTSIDPANVAVASEVALRDGSTIVTLNTGQPIHISAPGAEPTIAKAEPDAITGRIKVTQPDGSISFLAPDAIQPTADNVIRIGGRELLFNPNTGGLTDVTPRTQGEVIVQGGREFVRQPDGSITPLAAEATPDINDLINQRLLAGDAAGALALDDFRNRPTSLEAFNAAMQFAQAPGDVAAISAIARGQTLVQPPPGGTVQRIAEQPEFLKDSFARLMNQLKGGTGTPSDFMDVLSRISKESDERKKELVTREKELGRLKSQRLVAEALASQPSRGGAGNDAGGSDSAAVSSENATRQDLLDALEKASNNTILSTDPVYNDEGEITGYRTWEGKDASGKGVSGYNQAGMTEEEFRRLMDTLPLDIDPESGGGGTPKDTATEGSVGDASGGVAEQFTGGLTEENKALAETLFTSVPSDVFTDLTGMPVASLTEPSGAAMQGQTVANLTGAQTRFINQFTAGQPVQDIDVSQAPETAAGFRAMGFSDAELESLGFDVFTDLTGYAHGGTARGRGLELVGEEGPELVDLAPGTRVIPLRKVSKSQVDKLRKLMGVRGMQDGGTVGPLLPFGVRRALAGGLLEPTRRRLSTAAGIPVLSAQGQQNISPDEEDVLSRLSREAGISDPERRRELLSAQPGRNTFTNRARFAPRVLR